MKISEQLQTIIRISGLTQTQLAVKIGISFVALNNLINEKSQPRKITAGRINNFYLEITGQKQVPDSLLHAKKEIINQKSVKNTQILKYIIKNQDILDQLVLSLTYHTNKIEGSTLTENETAAILFENIALPNKTIVEQLEAKNHQTALNYLFNHLLTKKNINEALILHLHSILLSGINSEAGFYRRHGVRILGVNLTTANYLKVPELMKNLVRNIQDDNKDTILHCAKIHAQFEQIHPFSDGNGRIGRLLLQAMLLKNNLSPAIIKQENKILYLKYLNVAQIKEDYSLFEDFLCEAILDGYKIIERK